LLITAVQFICTIPVDEPGCVDDAPPFVVPHSGRSAAFLVLCYFVVLLVWSPGGVAPHHATSTCLQSLSRILASDINLAEYNDVSYPQPIDGWTFFLHLAEVGRLDFSAPGTWIYIIDGNDYFWGGGGAHEAGALPGDGR